MAGEIYYTGLLESNVSMSERLCWKSENGRRFSLRIIGRIVKNLGDQVLKLLNCSAIEN